jgi:hypothetical protein
MCRVVMLSLMLLLRAVVEGAASCELMYAASCQLPAPLLLPLPLLLAADCWLLPSPLPLGLRVGAPKAPPFAGRRKLKQATRWKKHQHQHQPAGS